MDLYNASSQTASNVLPVPFPILRHSGVNVSQRRACLLSRLSLGTQCACPMPMEGWFRLSRPGCLVLHKGGLPILKKVTNPGSNRAWHRVTTLISAAFSGYSMCLPMEGWLRLSRPGCLVLHRGGLPVLKKVIYPGTNPARSRVLC